MMDPRASRYLILSAWLLLVLGVSLPVVAEEARPSEAERGRIGALKEALEADQSAEAKGAAPTMLPGMPLDPETRQSAQRALKAYYDYRTQGFEHRRAVFEWQLASSKIIFAIVVFLVGIGVYFSWIQFAASMRPGPGPATGSRGASPGQPEPPAGGAVTTLEASTSGIKVSSPVLGVILLVISLAFFYLYLVFVYPIEEIF